MIAACALRAEPIETMEIIVIGTPQLFALKCFEPRGCRLKMLMTDCRASLIKS